MEGIVTEEAELGVTKGEPFSLLKSQATKGESFAKFGLIRKKHKDTRRGF
jgi:hypothetical protein